MTIVAARMKVEIGAETKDADAGMARVHKGLGQLGDVGKFALGTVLGNAITGAGRQLLSLGGEALSAYGDFERLGSSLQQMAAKELLNSGAASDMQSALAQTSGTAAQLQGWIQKLAIQSPFTQQGVADAFRMSMAYGFTTTQSKRLTQAMIDFAAGSGASEYTMSKIALALGQIQAKGKLAGGEVLQLTEAGLGVNEILAKAFGTTTAEIVDMREKGLIPADKTIEAIVTTLERDFGGAAARQSGTIAGLVSSLEDLKSVGLREAFGPVFREFQPDLDRFVQTLQDPQTLASIRQIGQDFAGTAREIVTNVGQIINWFQSLEGGTQGAVVGMGLLAANGGTAIKTMSGLYMVGSNLPALFSGITTAWKAWNAGLSLTTSLQAGLGTLPVTLGAVAVAAAAVVGVWIAWNENIAKTNRQGIEGAGNAMTDLLQNVASQGGDAAAVTDEFASAYGRMQEQIQKGGIAGGFVNQADLAKGSLSTLSDQLLGMGVSYSEYNAQMMRAAQMTGQMNTLLYQNKLNSGDASGAAQYLSQNFGIMTQQEYVASLATKMYAEDMQRAAQIQSQMAQSSGAASSSFLQQGQAAQLSAQQLGDLQGAWSKLQQAQQNFNQSFGDQVVNKLEQAGIKGEKLSSALGTIDNKLGTNYVAQQKANEGLEAAIANYKKTGDIKAFDEALGENKSQWEGINEQLKTAMANWNEFVTRIAEANGMHVSVIVDIVSGGGGGGGGGGSQDNGGNRDCFVGETPVNTPGGARRIDEIQAGELVLLKTGDGKVIEATIGWTKSATRSDLVQVTVSDGQQFVCAPNHQWKVKGRGWTWAANLHPGDELYQVDDLYTFVASVKPHPGTYSVYHVNVEHPEHSFLVGGIVVHNIDRKATGGPVFAGQSYLVGEEGPELFVPSTNGAIATHSMTQQMLAALVNISRQLGRGGGGNGGNLVPVINITESTSPRRTARNVGSELSKLQRR